MFNREISHETQHYCTVLYCTGLLGLFVHEGECQKLVLNSLRLFLIISIIVSYEGAVLIKVTHELVILIEVACNEILRLSRDKGSGGTY